MKKRRVLIALLLIAVVVLTGCVTHEHEKTLDLERNLYHDMESVYRNGLKFIKDLTDMVVAQEFDTDKLTDTVDSIETTLDNLHPPQHLADEVENWSNELKELVPALRLQVESPYVNKHGFTPSRVEALEYGRLRIYDGFEEFKWK